MYRVSIDMLIYDISYIKCSSMHATGSETSIKWQDINLSTFYIE